jgi:hypothetical protein
MVERGGAGAHGVEHRRENDHRFIAQALDCPGGVAPRESKAVKPVGRGDGHGGGGIFTDGSRSAPPLHGDVQIHRRRAQVSGQAHQGMLNNGYTREFAERAFRQLEGFGSYGFPESHAASFALIAYAPQAG